MATLLWSLASLRHSLLQSNSFDLGLFDQWAWQLSQGLEPVSSQSWQLHLLNDHGAWMFYALAPLYRLVASVQWLLALQALSLAFTAVPLWGLAAWSGLPARQCWLVCGLWWLQPVVFNTNLFDFHPEVLAMPLLAWLILAGRRGHALTWSLLLVLVLGWRDGLALVTLGLALEQLIRRRWKLAGLAAGLSLGWLWLLAAWIQPPLLARFPGLNAGASRYGYLGDSLPEIISALLREPWRLLHHVDWVGAVVYLLLISVPLLPFWRRASLPALVAGVPLVVVNLLSESGAQRSLVHHYSLPLAVIAVVAAIDGLASSRDGSVPWRRLAWVAACWVALAKPWFFTGPYLDRIGLKADSRAAIERIASDAAVVTTSYLLPHLSHRPMVMFPSDPALGLQALERERGISVLLLHPGAPGWSSRAILQERLLQEARQQGWPCDRFSSGLTLCQRAPH
ncbi:MAG: DUF2079 domain-containing protein [Cyanobium sp.]